MTNRNSSSFVSRFVAVIACTAALTVAPSVQTRITPDKNSYKPADDVKLGREAAAQVRKEMPLVRDGAVDEWVQSVGRRLVNAIPPEHRHPEFTYTFEVVNQKDINAFALPGGPMFLHRGMIEAAKSEGEVAGVMGHEISHVALRHGTAQATKGQKFQLGALLGQVAGAVVGGTAGAVIAQGSQFGLGTYFLKYGREYERQADLLGAQILARAGYDPRDMATMFKTIEAQGGGRSPEWLSSHPNPGNRYDAINREAAMLRVDRRADTGEFQTARGRLTSMSPAPSAEDIARNRGNAGSGGSAPSGRTAIRVEPPSGTSRTYRPGEFLRVTVPANWNQIDSGEGGVTYAPDGGYVEANGRSAFTHGVQFGVAQGASGNLQRDTDQLLQSFARNNPNLRSRGARRDTVGGRSGLTTLLANRSDVSGRPELVTVSTAQLRNGNMLFLIGVAPEEEYDNYEAAFRRIRQGLQINDR
ncbi:MAG TPA: M48 family metallopeptidase [Vicinamibacterales bacterium]|nr:M48 family metallopeptidase [Vicinamibacterales bacterium]